VNLVRLFRYVKAHFESHEADIRKAAGSFAAQSADAGQGEARSARDR
jgi:hypothetical protein